MQAEWNSKRHGPAHSGKEVKNTNGKSGGMEGGVVPKACREPA